ncbi:uncharacterized protein LOC130048553 [Ostrea edulis]|uniref:uncharacterized protein LOC130048553 n=1 Tax=Ostrea edulis TaxID=37623 RepID=UPI0024AF8B24|nr:uncharacterized protein LOC130048553 [Ostrea edulis]
MADTTTPDFQKADYMTIEVEMEITCDIKDLHVDNTTYNTTGYMYNDTVTYQCVEGFQHASGDLTRRCIGINTWSGRSPVCLECQCKCKASVYIHPNDTKAIEASVRKLKSELSIKVNETSKAQRRKTSATDDRASAKVVGSVLGGTLLASLVLLIVVSDASALLNNMRMACHNVKSRTQFRGKK